MSSQTKPGASRFELPALNLDFGNITDGTNIPPPPDSPVQKEPTPPQTPQKVAHDADAAAAPVNGSGRAPDSNGKLAGTKRSADDAPLSPPLSTRQGSLRRLFSRNTLNNIYLEGQQTAASKSAAPPAAAQRPMSQGTASLVDDRVKSKRSSSWFKRLRGGDSSSRRASVMLPDVQSPTSPQTPSGPPPPMIPELANLNKSDGGLGADLFKNIK